MPNRQKCPLYVAVGIAVWLPIQVSISSAILLLHPPFNKMRPEQMIQSSEHRAMLAFGETLLSVLVMIFVVIGMAIAHNRRNPSQ